MASRKIGFDPVAKSKQRPSGTCKEGGICPSPALPASSGEVPFPRPTPGASPTRRRFQLDPEICRQREFDGRLPRSRLHAHQHETAQSFRASCVSRRSGASSKTQAGSSRLCGHALLRASNLRGTGTPGSANARGGSRSPPSNQAVTAEAAPIVSGTPSSNPEVEWDTTPGVAGLFIDCGHVTTLMLEEALVC